MQLSGRTRRDMKPALARADACCRGVIGSPAGCFCLAISRVPSYRPALVIIRVLVRVLARHRVIVLKGLVTQTGIEGAGI